MANFTKELPRWEAPGIQPPDNLLKDGWKASQRPPADYFNWFFSRTYFALKELQDAAAKDSDLVAHERLKNNPHDVTATQVGLGNLINQKQATKVEFDTHNEDSIRHIQQTERDNWNSKAAGNHNHQWADILGVPIAGLGQKGIVQLLDSVASTDKTMAATPNSVRQAYDRGSTGIVDAAAAKKIAEDHIATKNNPHGTTKAHVGLGSVQDYGVASTTEAQTGSLTNRYMTPFLVNEAIKSLQAVKSVNGKTGEVVVSKSDVGLGNVDNVKQASKVEFDTHNNDSTRHISTSERDTWNSKMNATANAVSATKLQTPRKIAGKPFDGTADIDITTTDLNVIDIYAKKFEDKPSSYAKGVTATMVRKEEDGWPSYGTVTTINGYNNGGGVLQLYSPYSTNYGGTLIQFRLGVYPTDTWTTFLPLETTAGSQAKATAVQSNLNSHTNNTANPHSTTKTHVGLGNVDNVQQATKVEFTSHLTNKSNPHGVTAAQLGAFTVAESNAQLYKHIWSADTRKDNQPPSWYMTHWSRLTCYEFKEAAAIGGPPWGVNGFVLLETKVVWSHTSGGLPVQVAYAAAGNGMAIRYATSDNSWGGWQGLETTTGAQAKANAIQTNLNTHSNNIANPHNVTASQVGAYTKTETDNKISVSIPGLATQSTNGLLSAADKKRTDDLFSLSSGETLWSGLFTMNTDHSITPSKPLSKCLNGWIIYWSTYTGSTAYADQIVKSVIYKSDVKPSYGTKALVDMFMNARSAKPVYKGYSVSDTVIKGQAYNITGENLTMAAYKVESF